MESKIDLVLELYHTNSCLFLERIINLDPILYIQDAMPSTRSQKATPVKDVEHTNSHKKHESPNKIVHSKNAGGNISEYPVEFTKDSK